MSIKLKQAAQQALNALDEATTYTGSPSWSPSMTDECIAAASALRAALSQQPATGEPVNGPHCTTCGASMDEPHHPACGALTAVIIGVNTMAAQDDRQRRRFLAKKIHQTLRGAITHPAPSVPDDDFDLICDAIDKADTITMEGDYMLDSDDCIAVVRVMQVLLSVRAAMLAAK